MRTKVASFLISFQELSNKKKITALRPKMTKIASRGGPALITVFRVRVSSHLFLNAFASIPRMLVCMYVCMFVYLFLFVFCQLVCLYVRMVVYLCLFLYCQRFQIEKESFDDTVCSLNTSLFCRCVQKY